MDISQKDPRWVGAWGLGFMITGATMLLWTVPVVLFPGKMSGEAARADEGNLKSMVKGMVEAKYELSKFIWRTSITNYTF